MFRLCESGWLGGKTAEEDGPYHLVDESADDAERVPDLRDPVIVVDVILPVPDQVAVLVGVDCLVLPTFWWVVGEIEHDAVEFEGTSQDLFRVGESAVHDVGA